MRICELLSLLWFCVALLVPSPVSSQTFPCTFALSSTTAHLPAAGGSGTVTITPSSSIAECRPVRYDPRIGDTFVASSIDSNVWYFGAGPNPGPARTETLFLLDAIADPDSYTTFTVTQDGWDGSFVAGCYTFGILQAEEQFPGACDAVGGTPPYHWSVSAGMLPTGLSVGLNADFGSDFPTTSGPFSFTLTVIDSSPTPMVTTASLAGTVLPAQLLINCSSTSAPSSEGTPFAVSCLGHGGVQPYQWQISSGSLPQGLSMTAAIGNGIIISGTPAVVGRYSYTLQLADSAGPKPTTVSRLVTGYVAPPGQTSTALSLACTPWESSFVVGQAVPPVLCSASGGTLPYSWSAQSLPAGLSLNTISGNTIAVTGTPVHWGDGSFQVSVTDSSASAQTAVHNLFASMQLLFGSSCTSAPDPQFGAPTYLWCTVVQGTGPFHWAVSAGVLPAGLQQASRSDGSFFIYGTPVIGPYNFTLTVMDSSVPSPLVSSQSFSGVLASTQSLFGPQIYPGGVVGAGGSVPPVTQIASLSIASVYGTGFAPDGTARTAGPDDMVDGRLPSNLAGVCVWVDGGLAPILSVYPHQINFQVPEDSDGLVEVLVDCQGQAEFGTNIVKPSVGLAAPEFLYFVTNSDGINPIAAINASTGAFIGPPSLPFETVPARSGDIVSLFGIGFGLTTNQGSADIEGEVLTAAASITLPLQMTLGGVAVPSYDILYAGVMPGFVGLYQINLRIPSGSAEGDLPVSVTIGGVPSPSGGYLTVGH